MKAKDSLPFRQSPLNDNIENQNVSNSCKAYPNANQNFGRVEDVLITSSYSHYLSK